MPLIPLIRKAKAIALNTALARSKRWSEGGVVGNRRSDIRSATRPIGTLIANSHGHDATARIAAATLGPAADDIDTTTEIIATPRPNWRRGEGKRTSGILTTIGPPAARPCRARPK